MVIIVISNLKGIVDFIVSLESGGISDVWSLFLLVWIYLISGLVFI